MSETQFKFKQFEVSQKKCAMKINTDGVLLGAWVEVTEKTNVLDIGMGSGVIAMMLAQRIENARIVGVEIDEPSYEEASDNMQHCPWSDKLVAVHSSIQDYCESSDDKFDLIVSNPPFFTGGTLSSTQKKQVVRHAVKLPHNELLRSAYSLLSDKGEFSVVLPHIEGLRFMEMAAQYRFYCTRKTEVLSFPHAPIERVLLTFSKAESKIMEESLVIRSEADTFSKDYKALTKDFYLKF